MGVGLEKLDLLLFEFLFQIGALILQISHFLDLLLEGLVVLLVGLAQLEMLGFDLVGAGLGLLQFFSEINDLALVGFGEPGCVHRID